VELLRGGRRAEADGVLEIELRFFFGGDDDASAAAADDDDDVFLRDKLFFATNVPRTDFFPLPFYYGIRQTGAVAIL
jgi:hypothetical protein